MRHSFQHEPSAWRYKHECVNGVDDSVLHRDLPWLSRTLEGTIGARGWARGGCLGVRGR